MPLTPISLAAFGALVVFFVAAPVVAEELAGRGAAFNAGPHYHRRGPALPIPQESRYRDPRHAPRSKLARHVIAPDFLVQAYLPRTTETPLYNEPPSRFPQR